MTGKKWKLKGPPPENLVPQLAHALNITETTARLLIQRNIHDLAQAKLFLRPNINQLLSPELIPGISEARKRIEQALLNNERIVIYGDYDVDGVTAVALMKRFFRLLGREVDVYIPHRLFEGYGISKAAIDEIARRGTNLIITVDCGISNIDEIKYARQSDIDVVVTDHHEIPKKLPECVIVNPKLNKEITDSHFLSGVGVAFKLCWSMMNTFSQVKKDSRIFHEFLIDAMALVAMGTIADVSPMAGENRILCSYGLEAMPNTKITGLNALMKKTGLNHGALKSEDISFRLGPRINAAGRMGDSYGSIRLMTSDSHEEIEKLIEQLEKNNKERQKIEGKIMTEASKIIRDEYPPDKNYAIVLSGKKWHSGVLGIVASKLADEFYRPIVMISTENGLGKGSARSIPSFHLYQALCQCSRLLTSVGGHEYAAGLQIKEEHIPQLREKLNEYALKNLKTADLEPYLDIDMNINFSEATHKLLSEIKMIAPFGERNEEPVFCTDNIRLAGEPKLIGSTLKHLTFIARQENRTFRVIAYNKSDAITLLDKNKDALFSLAYKLKINNWRGEENIEIELIDIKLTPKQN